MARTSASSRAGTLGSSSGRAGAQLPFKLLDKGSFVPMYAQIQTQLLGMIHSGKLKPGEMLPSEEELSRVYGVSRMTARQALQSLKEQGLAERHKGLGTFVTRPKVEKDIAHLSGFTAEMIELGMKPSSKLLKSGIVPATAEIASTLAIETGASVFSLLRLRLADELPVAVEECTLSLDRYPGLDRIDFTGASLYLTLREQYGCRLALADEVIEAKPAGRTEAQWLGVPPRSSLLAISRVLWNAENEPVEMARSLYRGDRYRAVLRIPARVVE